MDLAKVGDKVVCQCKGGPHRIVTGASTTVVDTSPIARMGDKSSCGATITTGAAWFEVENAPAAIHGSVTSCGGYVETSSTAATGTPAAISLGRGITFQRMSTAEAEAEIARTNAQPPPSLTMGHIAPGRTHRNEGHVASDIAPGFIIVRKLTPRAELKRDILPAPTPEVDAMFERLNGHLSDTVLPGSLVVLSDPDNLQCRPEEDQLMQEASKVQQTLHRLEPQQAQAMVDHWGAFEDIALAKDSDSGTGASLASTTLGTFSAAGQNLFGKARMELDNLANLYQRTLDPAVGQSREQFHALREAAFQRIDSAVPAWLRRPLNLPATGEALKRKISVEARQSVHGLNTAMQGFRQFEIPSVSEAITRVGLASQLTSIGSAVGVGLDTYATSISIADACSTGREAECRRTQYIEYGRLAGRTAGGVVGVSAAARSSVCLAVSLDPRGKLICGVVAAGAGAYGGAKVVEQGGEWFASEIYQWRHGGDDLDSD